jgi:predicted phosphodiesterase
LHENVTQDEVDFLRHLPLYQTIEVEGLKFGISHNLPDKNWGPALLPAAEQGNFDKIFVDADCDVAVYGHVHHQMMRYDSNDRIIINPGSVGQPFFSHENLRQDTRAQYAILEVDALGIAGISFKKVSYDKVKELQIAREKTLPYFELYQEILEKCVTHTHDKELLERMNRQNNYVQEAQDYIQKLSKQRS